MQRRDLVKYTLMGATPAVMTPGVATGAAPTRDVVVPDARSTAPLPVPRGRQIHVAFLMSEGAEVIDFSGPWGVFEYATLGDDGTKPFKLYMVAAATTPVRASSGMLVVPTHTFANAPAPDVVVVPAMDVALLAPQALDWLRSVSPKAALTMSVCEGSAVLGRAGLLEGRRATTHHGGYGLFRVENPKTTLVRGARFVEDRGIATSGGLTSGIDLALRVVERYFGREVALRTARDLEYQGTGWMRPDSNAQFAKRPVGTALRPVCPVCEAQLPGPSEVRWVYRGKLFQFCGEPCLKNFQAKPEFFLST